VPRVCSVCSHASRQEIELALISGQSLRDIAGQFDVSKTALDRHRHEHLLDELRSIARHSAESRGQTLLDQADALLGKASELLLSAEASGDTRTALSGVREARACVELLAKLQPEPEMIGSEIIDVAELGDGRSDVVALSDVQREWDLIAKVLREELAGWHTLSGKIANRLDEITTIPITEILMTNTFKSTD
jgi:hypothetical protein